MTKPVNYNELNGEKSCHGKTSRKTVNSSFNILADEEVLKSYEYMYKIQIDALEQSSDGFIIIDNRTIIL